MKRLWIGTPTVWVEGRGHVCTVCRLHVLEPKDRGYVPCPRCPQKPIEEAVLLRLTYASIGDVAAKRAMVALQPMLEALVESLAKEESGG